MKKYIIDNYILSVFYDIVDPETLGKIYYEIEQRQKILINTLTTSTLLNAGVDNDLIEAYKISLSDSDKPLSLEDEKYLDSIIQETKLNESIESALNGFNKVLYDQAVPNLSDEDKLNINEYIEMVGKQLDDENQEFITIIEDELKNRKALENQPVITPSINLGGVMSNPQSSTPTTAPISYGTDAPIL
jgi:hypothetical protein